MENPILSSLWHLVTEVLCNSSQACGKLTAISLLKHGKTYIDREMAVGNTFGATALSSYGGFWLAFAIILTPGGFEIASTLEADGPMPFYQSFSLFLWVS